MLRLNVKKTNSAVSQLDSQNVVRLNDHKVSQPDAVTVTDAADIVTLGLTLNGYIADAKAFNFVFPDPGTGAGLPDLAEPGETIREKLVYGLTGDWDPTRDGDNNVLDQLDSGREQDVSDGIITYGFFNHMHALGLNNNPYYYGEGTGYYQVHRGAKGCGPGRDRELGRPHRCHVRRSGAEQRREGLGPEQRRHLACQHLPPVRRRHGPIIRARAIRESVFQATCGSPIRGLMPATRQLDPGFYGLQTLNHELGHALGLSHPGDYNFGDDSDGDGVPDPITYEGDAFYFQDNHQYTIMSYFDMFEAGNNQIDWNLMRLVYPSTPMVHDIWVAQEKYGAEMTTRTGDTTYGFNATADVTNDAMRFDPGEMNTIFSIWDAGGTDTLDLSGFYTPSIIDLREGAYSSAGGLGAYNPAWVGVDPSTITKEDYLAFVNANNTAEGLAARTAAYDLYFGGRAGANEGIPWSDIVGKDWLMENNIGIAYGAVIENAIGGHGNDQINGNQANNQLTGNDGADTFIIADYSGTTLGRRTVLVDTSVDIIDGLRSARRRRDRP